MKNKSLFVIIPFFCFAAILTGCSGYQSTPIKSLTPEQSTPTLQTRDGLPPYPTTAGWRKVHL
jgi:hypothetical protein